MSKKTTPRKTRRSELLQMIRDRSLQKGDFTLSSGQKSSYYIDLKETLLTGQGLVLVAELCADELWYRYPQVRFFGGLTLGADPIAVSLSMELVKRGKKEAKAFVVRKSQKSYGKSRRIEGMAGACEGEPVVVLEDVITTGGSTIQAIEALRDSGYRPVGVLAIVDREQGGAEKILSKGVYQVQSLFKISEILK
jgi:orotate phosphoribosyltransferase